VTLFQKHVKREKIGMAINVLTAAGRVFVENIDTAGRSETRIIAKRKKTAKLSAHNTLNAQ
jgi:hypothetical protein